MGDQSNSGNGTRPPGSSDSVVTPIGKGQPQLDFIAAVEQRAAQMEGWPESQKGRRGRRGFGRIFPTLIGILVIAVVLASAFVLWNRDGELWTEAQIWIESVLPADDVGGTGEAGSVEAADQNVGAGNDDDMAAMTDGSGHDAAPDDSEAGASATETPPAAAPDETETASDTGDVQLDLGDGMAATEGTADETSTVEPAADADLSSDAAALETPDETEAAEAPTSRNSDGIEAEALGLLPEIAPGTDTTAAAATDSGVTGTETAATETATDTTATDTAAAETAAAETAAAVAAATEAAAAETAAAEAAAAQAAAAEAAAAETAAAEQAAVEAPRVEEIPVRLASSHSGVRAQLADYGSEEEAQEGWRYVQPNLRDILGDYVPLIEAADVGTGPYYRLQIGYFNSAFAALGFCNEAMDRGVNCVLVPD